MSSTRGTAGCEGLTCKPKRCCRRSNQRETQATTRPGTGTGILHRADRVQAALGHGRRRCRWGERTGARGDDGEVGHVAAQRALEREREGGGAGGRCQARRSVGSQDRDGDRHVDKAEDDGVTDGVGVDESDAEGEANASALPPCAPAPKMHMPTEPAQLQ